LQFFAVAFFTGYILPKQRRRTYIYVDNDRQDQRQKEGEEERVFGGLAEEQRVQSNENACRNGVLFCLL
jgi:hypothetical protein